MKQVNAIQMKMNVNMMITYILKIRRAVYRSRIDCEYNENNPLCNGELNYQESLAFFPFSEMG